MQDTSSHHDAHDGTSIPLPDMVVLSIARYGRPDAVEEAETNVSHTMNAASYR